MSSNPSDSPLAPPDAPIIQAQGLGKAFEIYARPIDRLKQSLLRGRRKLYREFWALQGINLEVRRGEALGVIGRNGSGKSTLLQIIAGTLLPTLGTISVQGRIAALLELGSGFNPEFTGRENIFLNASILGLTQQETEARYQSIAEFADIGDYIDQPIKTYSTGMVMRLAFAVQVQVEPDILIIDEALAVGDALFQKRCFQKMEEMRSRGVTLFFVSHDEESIRTLTTRALLLEQGRPLAYGDPADVVLQYRKLLQESEISYFSRIAHKATSEAPPGPLQASKSSIGENSEPPAVTQNEERRLNRSDSLSFGVYTAEILSTGIFNEKGETWSVFYPLEKIRIRVTARVNDRLTHLNIGVRIRNKQGVKMYSWGTLNQDIAIWAGRAQGEPFWDKSFAAGETISVDFIFENTLGLNFYEVQSSITEERDRYYGSQNMLHWKDEAAFFQTMTLEREYRYGGVADLQMKAKF